MQNHSGVDKFATILPTDTLNGLVRIRFLPGEERTDPMAKATLAGPIADLIANETIEECAFDDVGGDFTHALRQILSADLTGRFAELWDETICYMTHPRVWRSIVSVADALLSHGTLTGSTIEELITAAQAWPIAGLREARLRLLSSGDAYYCDALNTTIDELFARR